MSELKEFKLPDVGEGMEEAEVVRWLVKKGDTVRVDQVMLEIQTDKALVEIPSPVAGKVAEIKVQEGQIAHVGTVLVSFDTAPIKLPLLQCQLMRTAPSKMAVEMSPALATANLYSPNGHSAVTSPNRGTSGSGSSQTSIGTRRGLEQGTAEQPRWTSFVTRRVELC